nr:hypothetical protein [Eubacteriales bacterium]
MKKGFQVLSITYLLKIALEISMLVMLNTYFKISSIPIFLIGLFNIDLGKFTVVKWLSILFIIFIIINVILFILSVTKKAYEFVKKCSIILPIVLILVAPLTATIALISTNTITFIPEQICSSTVFDTDSNTDYTYQKNHFGKIANLERNVYFRDNTDESTLSDSTADYMCVYRHSDKPYIMEKFELFEDMQSNFGKEDNKIVTDDYTLLYTIEENRVSYTLEIFNENTYFVSMYDERGEKAKTDYSIELFVEESLNNFNLLEKA